MITMALKLVEPPATEILTQDEVKAALKIDYIAGVGDAEGAFVARAISAARSWCEKKQGRRYITQTWEKYLDQWPDKRYIDLVPGLQSVISVKYTDRDGVEHILDPADYEVDAISLIGRVVLAPGKSWPSVQLRTANGICMRFKCGYGDDPASVPDEIKQAMLMLIAHWRQHPEAVLTGSISKEIEFAVSALLRPEEVMRV